MSNQRAFTLVELAVTVAVILIVSLVALPSMRMFILNYRSTTQASEFVASLNLARSEALKRQSPASVVAKSGTDFANGWTVFADTNGDGMIDAGDAVISRADALASGGSLTRQQGTAGMVVFRRDGTAGVAHSFVSKVAGCTGQSARTISISRVGRIQSSKANC